MVNCLCSPCHAVVCFLPPRPGLLLGTLAVGGGSLFAGQSEPAGAGPVVELPTFTVTDSRILPEPEAWRYGQAPGFEILSNAPDRSTQRSMRDFLLFQRAMGLVWPAIRRNFDLPVSLIFCAHPKSFVEFAPADAQGLPISGTVSLTLRDRELAAIIVDLGTSALAGDEEALSAKGGGGSQTYSDRVLRSEYVYFLLSRIEPRPSPWLQKGLTELFMAMEYSNETFAFPGLAESGNGSARKAFAARLKAAGGPPAALAGDKDLAQALESGELIPLDRLFSPLAEAGAGSDSGATAWEKQCYEFVHLCLFGDPKRFEKPFMEFSVLSALQPPTEDLFRRCFQMGYQDMLITLWAYTGFFRGPGLRDSGGPDGKKIAPPAPLALRDATEAESGRIRATRCGWANAPRRATSI